MKKMIANGNIERVLKGIRDEFIIIMVLGGILDVFLRAINAFLVVDRFKYE